MGRLLRLSLIAVGLCLVGAFLAVAAPASQAGRAPTGPTVFVDTDIGVDDAVAIAWLMDQRSAQIVGFTTVYGNTTVENATRNLLTLFGAAGKQYPVAVGAAAPLELPRTRTGAFVHGPDGFWFAQQPVDISGLPADAPAAIAAAARAHPGLTFIALGPLTNFAMAVQQYPQDLAGARLVALAGGSFGNSSPVAEFNAFADPDALEIVLAGPMSVELVTIDAFSQVTVDSERFPERLARRGGSVGALLSPLVSLYAQSSNQGAGGPIAIPDAAAVIYALRPNSGQAAPALVRPVTDGLARGQTIIADTLAERVTLIADDAELSNLADQAFTPGFDINQALFAILSRQPDNAQIILDVDERTMVRLLERDLTR